MTPEPYRPSWRKPAAALSVVAIIIGWAALVLLLSPWIERLPVLAQALVYLFLGIAWLWVLPLRRLMRWGETGRWRS